MAGPMIQMANFSTIFLINLMEGVEGVGQYVFFTSAVYFLSSFFLIRLHETIYANLWPSKAIYSVAALSLFLFLIFFKLFENYGYFTNLDGVFSFALSIEGLCSLAVASALFYLSTVMTAYVRVSGEHTLATLLENSSKIWIFSYAVLCFFSGLDFLSHLIEAIIVSHAGQFCFLFFVSVKGKHWSVNHDRCAGSFISTLFQSNLLGYLKVSTPPTDMFLVSVFLGPTAAGTYALMNSLLGAINLLRTSATNIILPNSVRLYRENSKKLYKLVKATQGSLLKWSPFIMTFLTGGVIAAYSVLYGSPSFEVKAFVALYVANQLLVLMYSPHFQIGVIHGFTHRRNYILLFKNILIFCFIYFDSFSLLCLVTLELLTTVAVRLFHDRAVEEKWRGEIVKKAI